MLSEIKKELINHPEKLKEVLKHFGYCNVVARTKYLQFGRDEYSSKKSLVVKLENNQYLYVTDYARNIQKDLFSYISEQRKIEFSEVLHGLKGILGISDYCEYFSKKGIFGGFYERIRKKSTYKVNTYNESILDNYAKYGNLRFLEDSISINTQQFFNIRYDVESQGIVIPIYDQIGQLIGIKIRVNFEVSDGEQKYYYLIPCAMSQTLYGYSQNYNYLVENTVFIFESEKSVMQCHSYGIRNCVALGSGSISSKQVQMIYELNPSKVIFMHDVGFDLENIMRNILLVKSYSRFSEIELGYWNYFDYGYEGKISPSDLGKAELERIINTEILLIGDDESEDNL
ncbi:hypothetical protein [Konateibacter massiliensis]|uniref:hypothetical protein n=1 Tax=Konateibacter massiliensis TaxID=2002841 RepID=UPI000C155EE4|nr:hypothetical protein [Konateibacter massiliensis]